MSGAECKKTMLCGQAIVFSASYLSPLSVLLTHLGLAVAVLQKREKKITPVMQATNWLKAGPKRRVWLKGGVFFY